MATYRTADFQAALERAVRYGAFSLSAMQRILAVQAQPKSCLEQLAEEAAQQLPDILRTPATPPRPPAAYQTLLFPETNHHDQPPQQPAPVDEQTGETDASPDSQQAETEALRAQIPMSRVLDPLGLRPLRGRSPQLRGHCPLRNCPPVLPPRFSVNLQRHIYRCFACRSAGNQLDLWAAAQQLSLPAAANWFPF